MKKVFVLFTVVMLMAVMAWEKQSGKPVESEFLLDNVEALAAGESGYDTGLGSGNVTCSTGDKVEYVLTNPGEREAMRYLCLLLCVFALFSSCKEFLPIPSLLFKGRIQWTFL